MTSTGSWSANKVYLIATIAADFRMRRLDALRLIRKVCGTDKISVPGTDKISVPKEKKEAKKRNIYITPSHPSDAPAPSFGTLEADVSIYLANAASENKTGEITPSRALGIRRSLAVLRDEMGVDSFARGLRIANAKGVPNIHYVKRAGTDKKSVSGTDKKSTLPAAVQDYLEGLK